MAVFRFVRPPSSARPWILIGLLALLSAGCAGSRGPEAQVTSIVPVTERDFAISAPTAVQAGEVDLRVENEGPDAHELLVVRAPNARLPLRSDGLTVDEEGLARRTAGTLEPSQPHIERNLRVRLKPGRYVLYCNMSGHFMGGMHTVLVVR